MCFFHHIMSQPNKMFAVTEQYCQQLIGKENKKYDQLLNVHDYFLILGWSEIRVDVKRSNRDNIKLRFFLLNVTAAVEGSFRQSEQLHKETKFDCICFSSRLLQGPGVVCVSLGSRSAVSSDRRCHKESQAGSQCKTRFTDKIIRRQDGAAVCSCTRLSSFYFSFEL